MAEAQARVGEWYREHGGALLRYLGRRFGRSGADDLLQETFVQALGRSRNSAETVSPRASLFWGWRGAWASALLAHAGRGASGRRQLRPARQARSQSSSKAADAHVPRDPKQ